MDSTNQTPVQQPQQDTTQQVQQPAAEQAEKPVQATSSTSIGPGHEGEPMPSKPMTEYASQPEMKLHPEVAEAGVEVVNTEQVSVPEDAAAAGVTPAKEATPISDDPHAKWPMTPAKAETILTAPHKVFAKSVVWLATLIKKAVKKEKLEAKEEVADVSHDA